MPKTISRVMVVALAVSASTRAAAQAEPTREAPTATKRQPQASPREAGVLLGQLTLAPLAALTPVALSFAAVDGESGDGIDFLMASLLLAPTVAGLTVCGIGRLSAYDGSCFASAGGAYLGALVGGLAGYYVQGYSRGDPTAQVFATFGGGLAGMALGAVVGWQASKKPRARPPVASPERAPAPPPTAAADPELRRRLALSSTAPGEARVIFPVLALSF